MSALWPFYSSISPYFPHSLSPSPPLQISLRRIHKVIDETFKAF